MHTVHFSVYVFQVVTLRVVHEKLLCLLPGAKQQALTVERVFEPFSGLNPLHYNPYTEVRYKELHVSVYLYFCHLYATAVDCGRPSGSSSSESLVFITSEESQFKPHLPLNRLCVAETCYQMAGKVQLNW